MELEVWEKTAAGADPEKLAVVEFQICPRVGEDVMLKLDGRPYVASVIGVAHFGAGIFEEPKVRLVVREKD